MSAQMAMAQQPAPRKPRFGLGRLAVLAAVLLGMAALGAGRAQATTSITQTTAWTYNSTTALVTSETLHSKATSPSTCISSAGDNTCSVTTTYTRDAYGNITGTAVTGTSLPAALNEQGSSISGRTTTTRTGRMERAPRGGIFTGNTATRLAPMSSKPIPGGCPAAVGCKPHRKRTLPTTSWAA
jgi:hypothetical protein